MKMIFQPGFLAGLELALAAVAGGAQAAYGYQSGYDGGVWADRGCRAEFVIY